MKPVRTRFAPSPTGFMHVGNFRTGLFAWLVARHYGGTFILRLEDTDKKREVEGSDEHIMKCFEVLGLAWDEGIKVGGPYAPYRQSERLESYIDWARILVDAGRAYADPYTPEEVEAFREEAQAAKKPFLYREHRPENPPKWKPGMPLRFKSDPKNYEWHDAVMGDLHAGPEVIDDFILIKSDGFPTYNFAHIIDDHEMQVSHVIRGQEFIASTPNYLNLYEALDFERPVLAAMPHILKADGKKKMGKRDGAKDVLDYFRDGFLPEAMVNFISSLGWNDGTEQEIFTKQELIEKFSLERVQRSGARFDEDRLHWMNGVWIRSLNVDELYARSRNFWPKSADAYDDAYKTRVLGLLQERLKYFAEIPALSAFFFEDLPVDLELVDKNKQLKKYSRDELKSLLTTAQASLEQSDFSAADLTERLNALLDQTGQKPGVLFSIIRIATTWSPSSPGLADTLAVLGKDISLRRLQASLEAL
ncbi:MAG TPA: glutamate--tRNA ligase [Candidatus Saccharimonadales bacterium]|nr:glutamate--tRNA ligase [Candidatus Saccharimonadales bacterium]